MSAPLHSSMPNTHPRSSEGDASGPPIGVPDFLTRRTETAYCVCGAIDASESCADALVRGWLSRYWHALQRLVEDRHVPVGASVVQTVAGHKWVAHAHTDLLQTLEFGRLHQPNIDSWFTQNGPILAQGLSCYMETRVLIAKMMEHNRRLASGLDTTLHGLYERVRFSEPSGYVANSTDTTTDSDTSSDHNDQGDISTTNIDLTKGHSDGDDTSDVLILVHDSDSDDGQGSFRTRHEISQ